MDNRYVYSVLVANHAGTLSRVAGLFTRRGFNISSLTVGETEESAVSRITIEFMGDDGTAAQLKKQLSKLEDVLTITRLSPESGVLRELALLKVGATDSTRSSIIEIAGIFRAKVDDVATESLTLEITGERSKIDAFIRLMEAYGIKELARTGITALGRGNEELKSHGKYDA